MLTQQWVVLWPIVGIYGQMTYLLSLVNDLCLNGIVLVHNNQL